MLTSSDMPPWVESRDVHFWMTQGVRPIACLVSGEALHDAHPGHHRDGAGWSEVLLDLLRAVRPTVEAAAARKFAAGSIKPDGTVVVLTGDLAQL
jgi:uncharacterized protein DUF1488